MAIAPTDLTLDVFLQRPEEKPPLEFFQRRVASKVSPTPRHGLLQKALVRFLDEIALPGRIGLVIPECRATFGGSSVVPDIVVIRWNRAPTEADGTISEYLHEPPAIAVEIVSPGQSVTGVVEKCLWYMANGVEVAILVDPAVESVLMFRPGKEPVSIRGAGTIDLEDILPGFRLSAERLFAEVVIRKD